MDLLRHCAAAGREELGWWLRVLARGLREHPGVSLVALASVWLGSSWIPAWPIISAAATAILLRCWALRWPSSFTRLVYGPVRGRLWCWWIWLHWPEVVHGCGLSRLDRRGVHDARRWVEHAPRLRRIRLAWPQATVRVRLLIGQTVTHYEQAADALRTAVGASQVRVEPATVNEVVLTFTIGDLLAVPFPATAPGTDSAPDLSTVPMGRREDGTGWRLPVGPHTLVAGCSGSGKGSVFWSFAMGLAPAVAAGRVQLHGIDLKGGMEILMGRGLFTMSATSAAEAVVVLETLVAWMRERTSRYAGRVRSHVPTTTDPLHVVMVDELAALTAYCPERDLQRRAELAINLLCSQGRAPGFVVFACLQDPRKEVIPSRGLFTQMVGLRLKDVSETTMVLGELAVLTGAHCHRLTRGVPGMGYVIPEDGGHPIRVRAGYVTDEVIRRMSRDFGTATHRSVEVPELEAGDPLLRPRRPRSQGAA